MLLPDGVLLPSLHGCTTACLPDLVWRESLLERDLPHWVGGHEAQVHVLVEPRGVRAAQVRHHRHERDLTPERTSITQAQAGRRLREAGRMDTGTEEEPGREAGGSMPGREQGEPTGWLADVGHGYYLPLPMVLSTRSGMSWQSGCTLMTRSGECDSMQALKRWWHAMLDVSSVPHLVGVNLVDTGTRSAAGRQHHHHHHQEDSSSSKPPR